METTTTQLESPKEPVGSPGNAGRLLTIPELRRELTPLLSKRFFKTNPWRVTYLLMAYAVLAVHIFVTLRMIDGVVPRWAWAVSAFTLVNVGTYCFFFMHEAIHGGVFKSRLATFISSFAGGVPFLCTPHLWDVWHKHHHRNTAMQVDTDRARHPDYDNFHSWRTKIHHLGKQFRYWNVLSCVVPFFVISGHHLLMFVESLFGIGHLKVNRIRMVAEFIATISIAVLPIVLLPIDAALLGVYLPLLLSNLICNVYILSNHNDSPLTEENYPLQNSASVYLARFCKITHMGFGRHVEHHIYPHVTHDKLAELTGLLKDRYPNEFVERNLLGLMHAVYSRRNAAQQVIPARD